MMIIELMSLRLKVVRFVLFQFGCKYDLIVHMVLMRMKILDIYK
jgi:hypothetical protein